MAGHDITDAEIAVAMEAGRAMAEREFRARAVRYVHEFDAIEVVTVRNGGFLVPRTLIEALQAAGPEQLGAMELWPDGSVIEIAALDIHISVDGIIKTALPVLVPGRIVAGLFASSGGAAKSSAKARSSRQNGSKGGRPRKTAAV